MITLPLNPHLARQAIKGAGMAAAQREPLLTCPCCGTPNFSARGLKAHHCRAKPDRGVLTPDELIAARKSSPR